MKIEVLLSSGDTDVWDDVTGAIVDMGLGGALLVVKEKPGLQADSDENVEAVYAPGMWMKVEYDRGS